MSVAAPALRPPVRTVAPCHRRAVERVIGTIADRLDQRISLGEMASVALLSPFHFHRIFRSATGVPPGRFLAALRIDEAKRLLLTSDLSVTEISVAVGYHSLSTFSSQFSKLVGLSPRDLRNLAKEGDSPRRAVPAAATASVTTVEGSLSAGSFRGLAFVGLFPTPIAEGPPAGCCIAPVPGPYRLGATSEGSFHLLIAALPFQSDPLAFLMPNGKAMIARSAEPISIRADRTLEGLDFELSERHATDPPILLAPLGLIDSVLRR